MVMITYVEHDGMHRIIDVREGDTVMEGARSAGVRGLPAECGGSCACATCHVYLTKEWNGRLPPIDQMEEDMLEFAPHMIPGRSRLSCQIRVSGKLEGLLVEIPCDPDRATMRGPKLA